MAYLVGGLLDFLSKVMEKAEGGTFDRTTDSNEALREKLDTLPTTLPLYTTTGTIVQDGTTGTPNIVSVVPSGSANTFGVWAVLDASAAAIMELCLLTIESSATANRTCVLEIGIGAEGAEAPIFRLSWYDRVVTSVGYVPGHCVAIPVPIKVAASARITARVSVNGTSADVLSVGLSSYTNL